MKPNRDERKLRPASALGALALAVLAVWLLPRPSSAGASGSPAGSAAPPRTPSLVVHFGDSFVDAGLQQTLRPKFKAMNTRYITAGRTSSWLSTWAMGQELDNLYWGYRPSLFLVTLGANDLFAKPADKRAYLVHEIVRKMRGTPCVWISIPIWQTAPTDLVEMTRRECGPCRHFDSNAITTELSRQSDHRHPDREGGEKWALAVWDWLLKERDPSKGPWALKPAPPQEHAPRPDPDWWGRAAPDAGP